MEFTEIYETMLGLLAPEAQVPGVENAFAEGGFCAEQYDAMRQSYERVCARLQVEDEDEDLDAMVAYMEDIQRDICERMYRLGMEHGKAFPQDANQGFNAGKAV